MPGHHHPMPVHHCGYHRHLRFPGGKLCKKITMEMVRTWKGWYSVFYEHNLALLLIIISTLKVVSPRNIPTSLTPNFFVWWLCQIKIIWENIRPFGFIGRAARAEPTSCSVRSAWASPSQTPARWGPSRHLEWFGLARGILPCLPLAIYLLSDHTKCKNFGSSEALKLAIARQRLHGSLRGSKIGVKLQSVTYL